jgi:hypothetical protein
MSTPRRTLTIPHAAAILQKLLDAGHHVYVHWFGK